MGRVLCRIKEGFTNVDVFASLATRDLEIPDPPASKKLQYMY